MSPKLRRRDALGRADNGAARANPNRLLSLLPVQAQRAGRGLAIVVILALGLVATEVVVYGPEEGCAEHPFECGVAGGLSGIALAALVGFGAFVWLTAHVRRSYRRTARERPRQLVPDGGGPKPEKERAARSIVEAIAPPSRSRMLRRLPPRLTAMLAQVEDVPPQLVIGQAGEGKTALLVQLTKQLSDRGLIAVPVALGDVDKFEGFLVLARKAFLKAVEDQLASDDEGDRIWRWICSGKKLVILADDLQSLSAADRDLLPVLFREAEHESGALVATSRSDGIGASLEGWKVPFDPPTVEEAVGWTWGEPAGVGHGSLESLLIRQGELNASWYYLEVLRQLREQGVLAQVAGDVPVRATAVRRWLLKTYTEAYVAGDLTINDGRARAERQDALSTIAQASLLAVVEGKIATVPATNGPLQSAAQAHLLRDDAAQAAQTCQVQHSILQSYLASLAIDDDKSRLALVRNEACTPKTRDTLLFFAGATEEHARARQVVPELLDRDPSLDDAISTALCAADIAYAANMDDHNDDLVQAFEVRWKAGGTLERRSIVERLARIRSADAILALWAIDGDYGVTWAAAQALVGDPHPARLTRRDQARRATRVLEPVVEASIETARTRMGEIDADPKQEPIDDWEADIRSLKRLGWVLPVLAVGADDPSIFGYLDELLELFGLSEGARPNKPLTDQRGPEASHAQGLKAAARLVAWETTPNRLGDTTLEDLTRRLHELYGRAQFWYSRLVLMHGLTDLAIAIERETDRSERCKEAGRQARETVELVAAKRRCGTVMPHSRAPRRAPAGFEHAFVVEAAQLCLEALTAMRRKPASEMREIRNRYIWDDEGVAVGASSRHLTTRALRLLGDLAILLNLNEKGGDGTRDGAGLDRELRTEFGETDYLPPCLTGQRERLGILSDHCDCPFGRCPYPTTVQRAHREISKLFCRHTREQGFESGAPPWQPRLRPKEHRRFWLEMERRAKYTG